MYLNPDYNRYATQQLLHSQLLPFHFKHRLPPEQPAQDIQLPPLPAMIFFISERPNTRPSFNKSIIVFTFAFICG